MEINIKEFAQKYLMYYRTTGEEKEDSFDSTHMHIDKVLQDSQQGLKLLEELINQAENEEELFVVAASPLENFIGIHAGILKDDFETKIRRSPRFRLAMSGVWHKDQNTPAGKLMKKLEYLWKNIDEAEIHKTFHLK